MTDTARTGRSSVRSEENLLNTFDKTIVSPYKSIRKLAQEAGLTYGSMQKALRKTDIFPYWETAIQKFTTCW